MPYEALEVRAGGLNHFSAVVSATYKENGADAYPDIRARAPHFFNNMPSMNEVYAYIKRTGTWPTQPEEFVHMQTEAWSERQLFRVILEKFGVLPITSDSHFGEYLPWAFDVADHKGILDFYRFYRYYLSRVEAKIELRLNERIVPIIEGIETDSGCVEAAVNVPNQGLIPELPDWLVVEVPAKVNREGVRGISPGSLPRAFAGLLANQVAVHDMTAEAVIARSRCAALQALLVDPVVSVYNGLERMLDTMIEYQQPWLDYLK